jgi:hypothetical protein
MEHITEMFTYPAHPQSTEPSNTGLVPFQEALGVAHIACDKGVIHAASSPVGAMYAGVNWYEDVG